MPAALGPRSAELLNFKPLTSDLAALGRNDSLSPAFCLIIGVSKLEAFPFGLVWGHEFKHYRQPRSVEAAAALTAGPLWLRGP